MEENKQEEDIMKLLDKLKRNFKSKPKWWHYLILFFLISLVLVSVGGRIACTSGEKQDDYFTANVWFWGSFFPVCMSLQDYDGKFLNGQLYDCLEARDNFSNPMKCEIKGVSNELNYNIRAD